MSIMIELDVPEELSSLRLPAGVASRLEALLDRQDGGIALTVAERSEAEGIVDLSEMLSLLRLKSERLSERPATE